MRQIAEIGRIFFEDRRHGLGRGVATKGALAGDHFVEHGAESKNVGAGIDGSATDLLGSHIAGGAHDNSGFSRRAGERQAFGLGFIAAGG